MKKPALKTNVPAKAPSKAVATTNEFDSGDKTPKGLEKVTAADLIIPRLTILQALSPQLKKKDALHIPNAKAGMFCDTAVGEVFDGPIDLILCFYARIFLEWAPRQSGSGLITSHGTDATVLERTTRDDKNRAMLDNGNYIAETATYYVLNLTAKGRRSFVPLTSTQLSASRRLMMKLMNDKLKRSNDTDYTPPIYYRSWRASVIEQSKNDNDWFGWTFEPGQTILELDPTRKLLNNAKDFYQQTSAGLVRGDIAAMAQEQAQEEDNKENM